MAINFYRVGQRDTRPWGEWQVVDSGAGFVIKRITVCPGKRLSLQRHNHRVEWWIVVSGKGLTSVGDDIEQLRLFNLEIGADLKIPIRVWHRIENTEPEDLVFFEVQLGDYLDENDIERYEMISAVYRMIGHICCRLIELGGDSDPTALKKEQLEA